jgi:hypothetical protein
MAPSWTDVLQSLASVGGLAIAAIGFWFVIAQLRQVRISIESDTHSKLYAQEFEYTKILFEHPEFQKYFRASAEIRTDHPNHAQVEQLAELFCTHFEHVLLQMENLPEHIRPRWLDYMCSIFSTSPILRKHLQDNRQWYSEKLRAVLGAVAAQPTVQADGPASGGFAA